MSQLETTNTRLRIRVQSLGAGDFPNNNSNNDGDDNDNKAVAAGKDADNADASNVVFDNNDIHRTAGSSCHDNSKITSRTKPKPKPPPPLNRTLTPATTDSSSTITGSGSEEGKEEEKNHDDDNNHNNNDDDLRWLGGEPCLMEAIQEMEGVRNILRSLSTEERRQMSDDIAMPVRHFRAEKGNTDLAIKKIKEALHWRRSFGLEELIQKSHAGAAANNKATAAATTKSSANGEDNTNCDKDGDNSSNSNEVEEMLSRENATGKLYVRGYDASGRALLYMRPGRENTADEVSQMRHLVWNLEKAIACTAKRSAQLMMKQRQHDKQPPSPPSPQPLEKVTLLIDYEGFSFRKMPPLSTSRYTLDILQKYYPERMHRAYILNPPAVFRTFWTIIRPFIDPVTKQKIVFCCSSPSPGWRRHRGGGEEEEEEEEEEKGGEGGGGLAPLLAAVGNADKLEPVAGGTKKIRDFCSSEYLRLPFAVSFDE